MILADVARVSEGKLDVLGGGWTVCGPDPTPMAIGLLVEVPWVQVGQDHQLDLRLLDDQDQEVLNPEGNPLVRVDGNFEAPRPPGVLLGVPEILPAVLPIPPLPLEPGRRYRWRLSINGHTEPDWELAFSTRPRAARLAG